MTEPVQSHRARDLVAQNLPRRYRAEMRFRLAGLAAVGTAVAVLLILLGSVIREGWPAFTAHQLVLPVELTRELADPNGDGSEASIRRGRYGRVLQDAIQSEFPEVTSRRELRALFSLFTPLNATRLMDEVLQEPALIGRSHVFTMPLADDLDLYLKGRLIEEQVVVPAGRLSVSRQRDSATILSTQPDFLALAERFSTALTQEAAALTDRANALRAGAGDVGVDEERQLLDAERLEARAVRLSAAAEDGEGRISLSGELPSLIVETEGLAIKIDAIAMDGRSALGTVLLGEGGRQQETAWAIRVIETPESRRRISDQVIVWTRALVERGRIKLGFNSYLFSNADSREPELAGVKGAFFGSILTMLVTIALSVPIGVATALYLEEYAPKNRLTSVIEVNINNLAAVPSIVFGLLGLAVFINAFGLPRSAPLVGGLVLSLMTLPTIIISTRAALKAVPPSIRQAALSVGASRTQTVFHHVLPLAAPGILTGSIIGLAQALGETAPLLMIGMVAFIADAPSLGLDGLTQPATVMPVQVFLWSDGAERAFQARTAAAILVLLVLMIGFNALAIYLRRRFERRW